MKSLADCHSCGPLSGKEAGSHGWWGRDAPSHEESLGRKCRDCGSVWVTSCQLYCIDFIGSLLCQLAPDQRKHMRLSLLFGVLISRLH